MGSGAGPSGSTPVGGPLDTKVGLRTVRQSLVKSACSKAGTATWSNQSLPGKPSSNRLGLTTLMYLNSLTLLPLIQRLIISIKRPGGSASINKFAKLAGKPNGKNLLYINVQLLQRATSVSAMPLGSASLVEHLASR